MRNVDKTYKRQLCYEHSLNVVIKQVCAHGLVSFGSNITSPSESIPRGYGPPFIAAYGAYCGSLRSHGSAIYYRSTSAGRIISVRSHWSLILM